MLAFILAAGPGLIVPGLGNFYAENWQAGFTLAAERVAALALAAMNLNADPKNALGQTLKYTGITFAVITYLYDVLTAPGYADIYNAVYVKNKSGEQGKVNLIPSLMKDGAGLNVAYSF
jgi:hypothetical protein